MRLKKLNFLITFSFFLNVVRFTNQNSFRQMVSQIYRHLRYADSISKWVPLKMI